jgi:proteic killer suppression protein
MMIRSFRNSETQTIAGRQYARHIPQDVQRIAFRKLEQLNLAETLNDLRVPPAIGWKSCAVIATVN